MSKFYLAFLFTLSVAQIIQAQERCGTEKFDSIRRQNNPRLETKDQFEQWMSYKLIKNLSPALRTEEIQATYTIPVVVHIIHNGQPLGTGPNISDAQILSQIKVLNNDFKRLNADASQTPAQFAGVAGSMSIEFVLAKQDPLGNPTTGIRRVNGNKSTWNLYQDSELKSLSYWPAEQYFNIWVTNFPEYLGYTQFPVSNLAGLAGSSNDRLTDGIIIHHRAFGSIDDGAFDLETQYNKGRTLTHEAGHFLGLRHTWGDATSCSATDYVSDTPPQIGSTLNCPNHPAVECSGLAKMFQNYLDYTDDRCMNIFTAGQVSRMEVVLQNSPRRASLLTSTGANPPGNFSVDLGVLSVETPTALECSGTHTPTVTIRNFGTSTITQASIELKINGTTVQTKSVSLSLTSLTQTQVTFNNYVSAPNDSRNFQFTILTVNGISDENASNNVYSLSSKTASLGTTPFLENFDGGIVKWNIVNPDGLTTWKLVTLPNSSGKAVVIENYNYENEGATDKIVSPAFDVSAVNGLLMKFKVAFAQYPANVGDALSVYVLNACSDDLTLATRVFFKEGSGLATTTATSSYFIPTPNDWKTQFIPLNNFIGSNSLRLAFVGRNAWGNNIYLDDIELVTESVMNLSIQNLVEPSLAVCDASIQPKLLVANHGTEIINTINVDVTKNGIALPKQSITQLLNPGDEKQITLNNMDLTAGLNTTSVTVTATGTTDAFPADNFITLPLTRITNAAVIPVRENFESGSKWSVINTGLEGWSYGLTNHEPFGFSATFPSYGNSNIGDESWLVSPKLDFSKAIEGSLFADFSYSLNSPNDEFVTISASTNCGKTFSVVYYSNTASNLADVNGPLPWNPASEDDWVKKYFNLDQLAGKSDILIAIKATNFNGNNLYVDNIEFYENDDPTPAAISEPFRVYRESGTTHLTFNLEESETVNIQVANIMGSLLSDMTNDNTLNQTYTFELGTMPGVYILKSE